MKQVIISSKFKNLGPIQYLEEHIEGLFVHRPGDHPSTSVHRVWSRHKHEKCLDKSGKRSNFVVETSVRFLYEPCFFHLFSNVVEQCRIYL